MYKEKSKKSSQTDVPFPKGAREIYFGPTEENNNVWVLGYLNLIETATGGYTGAIQFGEKVNIVDNTPFPLNVEYEDGTIEFHVVGATKDFDHEGPIPPEYHFMFNGICVMDPEGVVLLGTGGVPNGFSPSDLPTGDGQTVRWTSEGPGDSHPKHSK